jgi:hypothetical protein
MEKMAMPNAITDIARSSAAPRRRWRFPELLILILMRPDSEDRLVPGIVSILFHTKARFILNRRRVKHILAFKTSDESNCLAEFTKEIASRKGRQGRKGFDVESALCADRSSRRLDATSLCALCELCVRLLPHRRF